MLRYFLLGLGLLLAPVGVAAQDAAQPRYQMKEVEGGVVRLDTVTGDLTFCRQQGEALQCSSTDAGNAPPAGEIASLKARVEALEKQIAALKAGEARMPSDADIDKGLSIMEKFMRRFMDMAKEFDRENGARGPNHCDPLPQSSGTCL